MSGTKPPFRFWSFFFSLKGRVSRMAMWCFVTPVSLFYLVISQVLLAWDIHAALHRADEMPAYFAQSALGLISLFTFWPLFAVTFKRLHDVRLSGAFALIMLLPAIIKLAAIAIGFAISTWHWAAESVVWLMFVGLSILRGTAGANHYGNDPLQGPDQAAEVF